MIFQKRNRSREEEKVQEVPFACIVSEKARPVKETHAHTNKLNSISLWAEIHSCWGLTERHGERNQHG